MQTHNERRAMKTVHSCRLEQSQRVRRSLHFARVPWSSLHGFIVHANHEIVLHVASGRQKQHMRKEFDERRSATYIRGYLVCAVCLALYCLQTQIRTCHTKAKSTLPVCHDWPQRVV